MNMVQNLTATPWSSNILLLKKSGIDDIQRIERSIRYSKPHDIDNITEMLYLNHYNHFKQLLQFLKHSTSLILNNY